MNTTKKNTIKKTPTTIKEPKKRISKTWKAALANKGTGEILDMKAVLK